MPASLIPSYPGKISLPPQSTRSPSIQHVCRECWRSPWPLYSLRYFLLILYRFYLCVSVRDLSDLTETEEGSETHALELELQEAEWPENDF